MKKQSADKPFDSVKSPSLLSRFKIKLFWKILAWFWLSMVLVITLNLFIRYINSDKVHYQPLPPPLANELQHKQQRISANIERYFSKQKRFKNKRRDIFLLDSQGNDYFSRQLSELLMQMHRQVKLEQKPLVAFRQSEGYFGGSLVEINGSQYWLYQRQKSRLFGHHLLANFFRDIAQNLIFTSFLIGFPISFILSWLITGPIRRLQQASREMKNSLGKRSQLKKLARRGDEFGELAQDFDDLAEHLDSTINSQKQLLSDVSHELRSPLTRLKIALSMAENKLPPESHTDLARIKLESERMNEMLENLLAIARLEAQEINADKENFDLCPLFQAVIEDGRYEAEQSAIHIHSQLPESCTIFGVKDAMLSGIENILRNAIRYAGKNGEINCQLLCQDNCVELSISDTGPGVEQAQLDKIFDAFFRPEFERDRKSGGVGLGLSIAKRAFALNGGQISAQNVAPHGLKISIKFSSNLS